MASGESSKERALVLWCLSCPVRGVVFSMKILYVVVCIKFSRNMQNIEMLSSFTRGVLGTKHSTHKWGGDERSKTINHNLLLRC